MISSHGRLCHRARGRRELSQSGFTLIEVLASVVILGVGLLGMASLQVIGQRSNHSAYMRTQAVTQAYDMADRMRANRSGLVSGGYDSISGTGVRIESPPSDCFSATDGCSAVDLAAYDAWQWNNDNVDLLPSGRGVVARSGDAYIVRVAWDDDRSGAVDSDDPEFEMEFRP